MNDKTKMVIAVTCGNALEYFDLMLYAHFIFVLTPLFFPLSSPLVAELTGLSTVAIAYFIRPLGSIVFGYIGDRWGRRRALMLSLGLMIIPTFTIGILPTYGQVGILAPILLLGCRLLQNFCVSGETTGVSLALVENAPIGWEGRYSSLLNFSTIIGSITAALLGYLSLYFFPINGWRIPFIIGSLIGLGGVYFRRSLQETPPFQKMIKKYRLQKNPLLIISKKYKHNFFCIVGIGAGVMVPFYLIFIHLAGVLNRQLQLDSHTIMLHNILLFSMAMVAVLMMGLAADRIGKARVMKMAAAGLMLLSYPLFSVITQATEHYVIFLAQIPLVVAYAGLAGPTCALTTFLFPVSCRYSGIAFAWSVSGMLFIGILPSVGLLLERWLANPAAFGYYLAFCGLLGWLAIYHSRPLSGANLGD